MDVVLVVDVVSVDVVVVVLDDGVVALVVVGVEALGGGAAVVVGVDVLGAGVVVEDVGVVEPVVDVLLELGGLVTSPLV